MALGTVQAGYGNSLYVYSVCFKAESELSYAELLAELTTGLELAYKGEDEESVMEERTGEDSEQTESHFNRKKEWESLLEQSEKLEVMLRQMLENGLGQKEESQKERSKQKKEEELDNDFSLSGVPAMEEGRQKENAELANPPGNSEFLQRKSGNGAEYFSLANGGRMQRRNPRLLCLTCETECDQKKQWKITE